MTRLRLERLRILAYRRRAQALDARLRSGAASLGAAAHAGLQDSAPRAGILSLHARVEEIRPDVLADPSLVQVWGPRYSAYVIAAGDVAPFTLGRLPEAAKARQRAHAISERLHAFLDGREMRDSEAGRALGIHPNAIRYGAPTGTILIRWDGARATTVRMAPAPDADPFEARLELARRYLHVSGPATAGAFAQWAGITLPMAQAAFEALRPPLTSVRTPVGDAWILGEDASAFRSPGDDPATARLLPSGDPFWLLWDADRELLVPDADHRRMLWTPRVWPGALLVAGDLAGTWRRAGSVVHAQPWRRLSRAERQAVEAEAASLPLPGVERAVTVHWEG